MNIKTNLARKRSEVNITQKELARNTGVELRNIRAYESGERDINKASGRILYLLSKELGCSIDDILEIEEIKKYEENNLKKFYAQTDTGRVSDLRGCILYPGSTNVLFPFYGENLQDAVDSNLKTLLDLTRNDEDVIMEYPDHAEVIVREEEVTDRVTGEKRTERHIKAEAVIRVCNHWAYGSPNYAEKTKVHPIFIEER